MEFLYTTKICIPLNQVILLLIITTVMLAFKKPRLSLFTYYLFAMYWGYIANREILMTSGVELLNAGFPKIYFGFGSLMMLVVLFSLMRLQKCQL